MGKITREEQIRRCPHCFALIKKGYWSGGFHSSDYEYIDDVIECVRCGLTNKNMQYESRYSSLWGISIESTLFREIVYDHSYSRIPFDIDKLNMLSKEEIGTREPRKLWYIAKEVNLNLDINNKDCYPMIFDTIQELVKLAKENKLFLTTLDSCYKLMEVYNNKREVNKEIK